MQNRLWIAAAAFILTLSSCNLPDEGSVEPPHSAPTPVTPTSSPVTQTPIPVETIESPTIIPTVFTFGAPLASPVDQAVNCRFGPGTSYSIIGILNPGRRAEITGRNEDSSWWYVKNPNDPSTFCWLLASLTEAEGDVDSLPVVDPPDITVTSIHVSIDPPAMNVACEAFPQVVVLSARITTNGPSTVTWRWEASTGEVSPEKSLLFEEGGSKIVQDYFRVNRASDYSMQVRTLSPNGMTGQANFKVTCTP